MTVKGRSNNTWQSKGGIDNVSRELISFLFSTFNAFVMVYNVLESKLGFKRHFLSTPTLFQSFIPISLEKQLLKCHIGVKKCHILLK